MLVPLATEPPAGMFTELADAYILTVGDYVLWLHKQPFGMEIRRAGVCIFELETEQSGGEVRHAATGLPFTSQRNLSQLADAER